MSGESRGGRGLFSVLDRTVHRVGSWTDHLSALVCAFLITATTLAVIVYQVGIAIAWLDDLLRMALIWLVYLGSVPLCFDNDHISMDAVYLRLPPQARKVLAVAIALLGVVLCGFIAYVGYDNMRQEIAYGTLLPSGYLPAWPQSLAIPLCFALMTLAYISYLFSVMSGRRRSDENEANKMAEGV
jgi:C4-dicarboxylate transporter DctQ subunit